MNVQVKLFAVARELAGGDKLDVEIAERATLADLRLAIAKQFPALQRILPHTLWAVDAEYAGENTIINEHSDIALIPPVSGG
jgi:molybdopterin converting factor subunit 1